jgi:tetratricopeptide (TPR) repeat protein
MKKIIFITTFLVFLVSCASNENKEQTPEEKKADLYYELGTNELMKKNYLPALTSLLQAKGLAPKDSKIRNNLGMAYYFKGQPELAITELKEAISLDNKNTDAKVNLGTIYFEKKKNKDARKLYEEVLTNLTFENQFRTYYNLALVDLAEGDRRGAFLNLEKSIKEKEDYCPAHFKLGQLYSEEYKFKEALASYRNAGQGTCVSEPAPVYEQAVTLINLERKEEAKKKFQELINKFPKSQYKTMAISQIHQLNSRVENQEETFSINKKQTEVIPSSPKF